jgi:formate/nitrite transporter FocA (FNT family)
MRGSSSSNWLVCFGLWANDSGLRHSVAAMQLRCAISTKIALGCNHLIAPWLMIF